MKTNNTISLNRKINIDIYNKLYYLSEYYDLNLNKTLEHIIDRQYDIEINNPDIINIKQRQECMTCMCKVVNTANCIEDDELRKSILEEVESACRILNK